MADLTDLAFDSSQVEPDAGFEVIPAGDYIAIVTDTERKPTKAGTGQRLAVTMEVADGPLKGRKIFEGFNLQNPNAQAVKISMAQLSALCRAVGVGALKDSAQLHNVPFTVTLGVKKGQDGDPQNVVKKYAPRGASAPQSVPASVGDVPPWQRN